LTPVYRRESIVAAMAQKRTLQQIRLAPTSPHKSEIEPAHERSLMKISVNNWTALLTHTAFALLVNAAALSQAAPQAAKDPLRAGFENPPNSARPRVWWHWMNGNITKEGIKLDLEWMHRVGIGGFQNFDAALNTPKLVEKRLVYMTPEWKDAFLFTTKLAEQLGLDEAIAGSPGWSESGGPWVKPAQGMKKFVWTETVVQGGQPFTGALAKPPTVSGPYQNIPVFDFVGMLSGQKPVPIPEFYADSAAIAYRLPESEVLFADQPKITSSSGTIDAALLADGDFVKTTILPKAPVHQQAWVQFAFTAPQTIRALTFALGGPVNPFADISGGTSPGPDFEASDDGRSFHKVATVPNNGSQVHTISFSETTSRFFRLAFTTSPSPSGPPAMQFDADFGDFNFAPPTEYPIAEIALHTGARVNRAEEKAAFTPLAADLAASPTPSFSAADATAKNDVVDLTSKMHPDGTLDWTPPAGRWAILRLGYSLLGITNHPASPEGTGFEVDKLDPAAVKSYMNTYLDNYKSAVGPLMGKRGLRYVISDSWEAGAQNWTDNLIPEFSKRRGYDPRPWLPVLTGRVIESSEASDRFLWDFRHTLSDLLTEYHYDQLTAMLHERGMGHYGESHESGRAFIGDGMEVKRTNDVPMAAMWTQKPGVNKELYGYDADIRESASVAHIYGQNLVAAESMTASSGAWAWSPETLKPTADKELAMGLNRFVIHTSVHQPLIGKAPGLALGPFGQWFTRNETWAEEAKAWITYLARSSFLLQQGHFAADVAYFYGEDSNLTAIFGDHLPDVPPGYNYDYFNADALIHKLSVSKGILTTPSGMSYRILALDPRSQQMSLPVLRKIQELVEAGAVVVGAKPTSTPSLSDSDAEFHALADQLWGTGAGKAEVTTGKGRVFGGAKISAALDTLKIARDFSYSQPETDSELLFVHRHLTDADFYFVDNRRDRPETLDATFRIQGKQAEIWRPDTGAIEPASFQIRDGRTTVPLTLEPWGTVFVVFRKPASTRARTLPAAQQTSLASLEGPWDIQFQPGRGSPEKLTLATLASWSENSDPGVKYFSGTGIYSKTLEAPADWFKPGAHLWLDLGSVKNLAQVTINGKPLGLAWKTPFRLDATAALKPGANHLEIKIISLWANRIIGDRQPNAPKQYTFTSPKFYKADAKLIPSGLLGPVEIIRSTN